MGVFIQYCIEHLYCILLCTYISGQTEKVECTDIKAALVTLVPLLVVGVVLDIGVSLNGMPKCMDSQF